MNLPAFCIRRPAFTVVISLVLVIIGLLSFTNLPVRWIPNVSQPVVQIQTIFFGANARVIEKDITKPLEQSLSGINNIDQITSNSSQGRSVINIEFRLGTNMNNAVQDVRNSIERVRSVLPRDVESPMVMKTDSDNLALLYITFHGGHYSDRQLSDYIKQYLKPSFETIDGVGYIYVPGERISAMHVLLDPAKMASANVTAEEVTQLLQQQNSSIASGEIQGKDRIYSVLTDTALKTVDQFNNLIIRDKQNKVVKLKDIGEAKIEPENVNSALRINGKNATALAILTQSTANPLDVEAGVQKVYADIKKTLPAGMETSIEQNTADYIRASIHSVYESFAEAIVFVWLVIFVFLASFRATLIPVLTIPVCLISTFSIVYFFGFSINTITLMAFVLAIGLVVDDAIVMLENIKRHIEDGLSAFEASLKGSREIIFPIIAMTLTLTAVYAPIAFTPGLLGILFREFTFTLAGAVIISGIVALTLSPMMCARILKASQNKDNSVSCREQNALSRESASLSHNNNNQTRFARFSSLQLAKLQQHYSRILGFVLKKRIWFVLSLTLLAGIGFSLYKFIPAELAPNEDMNEIQAVVIAPHSANFPYTDNYVKQMEEIYARNPDIVSYLSLSGLWSPSFGFQILKLQPKNKRHMSTEQLLENLNSETNTITGARTRIFTPSPPLVDVAGNDQGSLGLIVMTTSDYRKLQNVSANLVEEIRKNPGFAFVNNRLRWDSEQFHVNIDRDKAADLKVPISNITNTISTMLAGRMLGKVDDANLIVKLKEDALADPNIIQQLYVRNIDGNMIPLSNMITISDVTAPEAFNHYNRLRSDTIQMALNPGYKLADAVKYLQKLAKDKLPDDVKYTFTGEAKSFLDSNGKTIFTFALALVFIYLVLVAQFESFIDPLIILLTVPFAVIGALLTLKIFGGSLNIYSNIGLITLIGLIAKHGILITEFANRLRRTGKTIQEAVIESAILRLRPILMTTAAMVLGALPLAFAFGPGGETRQQIGLVITGGLLFGTFFSLIVIPIVYTYLAPFQKIREH